MIVLLCVISAGIVFADTEGNESVTSGGSSDAIGILLDGVPVVCDVPPVIEDGRTLIPVRALFEAMDGTLQWNELTREVMIHIDEKVVVLTIDSKTASVNGIETTIDVPAKIIDGRTLIPVRFVTESIGCSVEWDDVNRTVIITSPQTTETEPAVEEVVIPSILVQSISMTDGTTLEVKTASPIKDYHLFYLSDPDRLVLDLYDAGLTNGDGKFTTIGGILTEEENTLILDKDSLLEGVRYAQYDENTVRIVIDLNGSSYGFFYKNEDKTIGRISFSDDDMIDNTTANSSLTSEAQAILNQYGLTPVVEAAKDKLVVIDPGHGGADTGSIGYLNGVAINEKDINLDIALRVQTMLEAAGANIYMIRTTDETIALYDRQDMANSLRASLYVSTHNNSYDTATPHGTETLYYSSSQPDMDGISGYDLAQNLQAELIQNLGLYDRGAKASPKLAVLRRTNMPAVIVEGGFLSNPNDLQYMMTDEFRQLYAKSVADCIIKTLNNSVSE